MNEFNALILALFVCGFLLNQTLRSIVAELRKLNEKPEELTETLTIELEQESDGRWIADATWVRGALAYGTSKEEATRKALEIAEGEKAQPEDTL